MSTDSFDGFEDHFHRAMTGNPRKRIQLIAGSLFVLAWFAMDVTGFALDHWFAAPVCLRDGSAITIVPAYPMPNDFEVRPHEGPARNDPTPGNL